MTQCEACSAPARHRISVYGRKEDKDYNMINLCDKCRGRVDEDHGCIEKMFDIIARRIDKC